MSVRDFRPLAVRVVLVQRAATARETGVGHEINVGALRLVRRGFAGKGAVRLHSQLCASSRKFSTMIWSRIC
jgi:hypothetical protein